MDPYGVLKVSKDASNEEVKKAFRKLAVEHHPDKNPGNKQSEEIFKNINEAYSILSDPEKRRMFDQFGTVDGIPNNQPNFDEVLKNMFGTSFSFSFGGGAPAGNPFDFFGEQRQTKEVDVVEIMVDINDIYYGHTKGVEFEILDKCDKCNGLGAQDPSGIVKCITCNGQGHIIQQMGPFFMQKIHCPSCNGRGQSIKQNKTCQQCKGEKACFVKRVFQLIIPKGIPDRHEVHMEKKGSFIPEKGFNKDMIFKFKHDIKPPYTLDQHGNVTMTIDVTIEELLGGFTKIIMLYKDQVTIKSDHYFNPTKVVIVKEKGVFHIKKQKHADLHLKFNVIFTDGERLIKYHEVFHKVVKRSSSAPTVTNTEETIHIQTVLSTS